MKRNKSFSVVTSLLLVGVLIVNLTACTNKPIQSTDPTEIQDPGPAAVQGTDLMEGTTPREVSGRETDDTFKTALMNFSLELFKASASELKNENQDGNTNLLISPLSVQLALAMTANGADGSTREEMETLLGGTLSIEELNEYLYSYVQSLPSGEKYRLEIADSIWFRDEGLSVNKDFLQTNADYYGAQAYQSAFDGQTAKDINNWVSEHTDGMIEQIIEGEIPYDAVMYLINALVFDAEWETPYNAEDIREGTFLSVGGEKRTVDMMYSAEARYLDDGRATGFIKNYSQGKYSFAALLPNEDVNIYDYIDSLTNEELLRLIENAQEASVDVCMPKFSYSYELSMEDMLSALGMPTAFDSAKADFSKLGAADNGNIFIGEVLHKTFISVDELGTKAGAVTSVMMKNESIALSQYSVTLDRPFVYVIIENSTGLPVFMGTVMDIQK